MERLENSTIGILHSYVYFNTEHALKRKMWPRSLGFCVHSNYNPNCRFGGVPADMDCLRDRLSSIFAQVYARRLDVICLQYGTLDEQEGG